MTIRTLLGSAATAVALSVTSPAFAADSAQEFVNKAAVGGMFEVESSKVALGKAHDPAIKDFAQKMIADHGAANAKLVSIAGEQNLQVPTTLDAKHKSDLDAISGADPVDGTYVELQRDAHEEAVSLFESYANDGDNATLKEFAAQTLPTLKMHQKMVDGMASNHDGSASDDADAVTPAVNTTDTVNPSAPVPGANSFTEAQAKSRIEEAGFSNVSALTKDDQGIWRGQASKDGKNTGVALDFQGNVVAATN